MRFFLGIWADLSRACLRLPQQDDQSRPAQRSNPSKMYSVSTTEALGSIFKTRVLFVW